MKYNADAIVKALKCCNVPSGRACSECPYHEIGAECRTQRNKDAIELILKLTEENRNLSADLKDAEEEYERVYEQAEADIRGNIADGGTSCHWCIAGHRAETVQKMQKKLEERIDQTIQVFDFQISECNAVRQALRGVKNDIYQIAKEMLEENNV